MSDNMLHGRGAAIVGRALQSLSALTQLQLQRNGLEGEVMKEMAPALQQLTGLQQL
jgi:hypothetical protein